MSIARSPGFDRQPPAPTPCTGCDAACGPDDVLVTASGRTAICQRCWDTWRGGGYSRTVRVTADRPAVRQAKDAKNAILASLARHEQTVDA